MGRLSVLLKCLYAFFFILPRQHQGRNSSWTDALIRLHLLHLQSEWGWLRPLIDFLENALMFWYTENTDVIEIAPVLINPVEPICMVAMGGRTFGLFPIKIFCFFSPAILKLKTWHPYNPGVRNLCICKFLSKYQKRESCFQRSQRLPTPLLE